MPLDIVLDISPLLQYQFPGNVFKGCQRLYKKVGFFNAHPESDQVGFRDQIPIGSILGF
jgi:hypothetical protein